MKFKDPETGTIFSDLIGVYWLFCRRHSCKNCKFSNARNMKDGCWGFVEKHPAEAAHLMGYEVVDCHPLSNTQQIEKAEKPARAAILDEAKRCVCGQREQDYGSPENNFRLIASLWEPYIRTRCVSDGADVSIMPEDVAMLMALLKIARICSGTGTQDSFVDCCGYMACGGEIAGGKK